MLTVTEAKLQLNIDSKDTSLDAELTDYVNAAVAVVERHLNKVITPVTVVDERHRAEGWLRLMKVPVIELVAVTAVDGSQSWDVAGLDVDAGVGLVRPVTTPPITGLVEVDYRAGFENSVPANYDLASRIVLQHLWETQRGRFGAPLVGGMEDSLGNLSGGVGRGYAIPNAALELLGHPAPGVA